MPSSNPPPEDSLNTYFAVQVKQGEPPIQVVADFMRTAKSVDVVFRRLELMDTVSIGTFIFARMRTEILNPYPVLDAVLSSGRAVVNATPGGEYVVRLPGGRSGKTTNLVMHATPKLGQARMFRGPRMKYWERQFDA